MVTIPRTIRWVRLLLLRRRRGIDIWNLTRYLFKRMELKFRIIRPVPSVHQCKLHGNRNHSSNATSMPTRSNDYPSADITPGISSWTIIDVIRCYWKPVTMNKRYKIMESKCHGPSDNAASRNYYSRYSCSKNWKLARVAESIAHRGKDENRRRRPPPLLDDENGFGLDVFFRNHTFATLLYIYRC